MKNIPYIGEKLDSSSSAGASTFVIAYAVNKGRYEKICVRTWYRYLCNYLTLFFLVFGPVRMAITAASTPFIVKYLKTLGYFKKLK